MSREGRLAGEMHQFREEFDRFVYGDNRNLFEKIRDRWYKTQVYRTYKLLKH